MKKFDILIPDKPFFRMLLILSFFVFTIAFIPAVGFIFLFFLPQQTMFYSAVAGKFKTTVAFSLPVLLIILVSHLLQLHTPYLVILIMGLAGMMIYAVASQNNSIEKTIIYPALLIIGAICAFFLYSGWELSLNPWKLVQQFIEQATDQNINFYAQLPFDKEEISLIKESKPLLVSFFTGIFPALAIIGSVIIIWINVLMGRDILRKTAITLPRIEGLSHWKAPEFLIWIFIIAGGLLMVPDEQLRFIGLNIFILSCFIYFLQGLAIFGFLFQHKNVPVFFRYLFYFLIAVWQFLMIPVALTGLFDIWIDFRRFMQKDQTVT